MGNDKLNVFVSYSHADDPKWLQRVQVHLKPLARNGHLDLWDDHRIEAGNKWRDEIQHAIDNADVAVLLISADFYASDFIAEKEVPKLLEAAQGERGLVVLGVHINYSHFEDDEVLSGYQTINRPNHPLEALENKGEQEKVFQALARRIKGIHAGALPNGVPAPVQPTGGYRGELLEAFETLCQGAEIAFAANHRRAAKCLLESFRSWQRALDDALDDPELLGSLPQFLADRERDIADELLDHYFNQNPATEVLALLNELSRRAGPLVDLGDDEEDLCEKLLASIDEVLAKIRSGSSGLDQNQAKSTKRALLVIRGEIAAPRYNPKTVSAQRVVLEGLQIRLLERPRLLTEALLGRAFPNLPDGAVFRHVPEIWCPQLVMIPTPRVPKDSLTGEAGLDDSEAPQYEASIDRPFALGRYAMTFQEYDHFCEMTGRKRPEDAGWGRGRRPVIQVDHDDALAHCGWLSEATGASCQLPTEAMWEYACRAGTTTSFSYGEKITTDQVNFSGVFEYDDHLKGEHRGKTVPVGSLPANAWGLYDMHGNVWEWCADAKPGNDQSMGCAMRGGSWRDYGLLVRSFVSARGKPDLREKNVGFRCACIQGS